MIKLVRPSSIPPQRRTMHHGPRHSVYNVVGSTTRSRAGVVDPLYKKTSILVALGDSEVNSTRVPAGAQPGNGRLPENVGVIRSNAMDRWTQPSAN